MCKDRVEYFCYCTSPSGCTLAVFFELLFHISVITQRKFHGANICSAIRKESRLSINLFMGSNPWCQMDGNTSKILSGWNVEQRRIEDLAAISNKLGGLNF